jgi:hypothetical protein
VHDKPAIIVAITLHCLIIGTSFIESDTLFKTTGDG